MSKIRPFLKWAGSKYNCLNQLLSLLPEGKRLVEPFAGSGVVFMNANYASYVIAEQNADLIHLFSILKKEGESFIHYCHAHFTLTNNNQTHYYEMRDRFNSLSPGAKERAALFLYLNRHGYNGLCRYNAQGLYNVPFGLYTKPYFPYNEMMAFHNKSTRADFTHCDFRATFALAEPGDVLYCDPPYVPFSQKTKPIAYTKNKFTEEDQIELAELARETASKGIHVLISNHDTEFTRKQYQGATITSFPVARFINCQADQRQPVRELIAIF